MCYKKFHQATTFLDAEEHCQTEGGHLARISSEAENDFIGTMVVGGNWWIGLWSGEEDKCYNNTDHFVWTDGTPFSGFSNWGVEPHIEPNCCGRCVVYFQLLNHTNRNTRWYDTPISDSFPNHVCALPQE